MLADVVKQKEQERIKQLQKEKSKYNKPYKRDTIIYFSQIHVIGGIETWIYNLSKRYEFSVVYDKADKKQLKRLNDLGIETILNVEQPIECNTLLFMLWGNKTNIRAKKRCLFLHGVYNNIEEIGTIPEYDEIYAVSKVASDSFYKTTGIKPKVLYNPIEIEHKNKPLIFGVFSRLSKEKGKDRIIYLLNKLVECNKQFLMFIFTDLPFDYNDNRVIFIKPTLDIIGWMEKMDYIVQLSDTEAGSMTIQEALKIGKPLIITKLPILEEFGINKSNAKILEFNMSNLDIEDLWNIPVVKNWKEPISKEWEEIMKKKVFRKLREISEQVLGEEETNQIINDTIEEFLEETKPKKTIKKKKSDK